MKTLPWTVAGLLLLAALAVACRSGEAPHRNLLLVTVDTLRADRLGAWGYPAPTSPHIDALAAESVTFVDARAPSSWTLPSLASLMTSLHSSTHRCWSFRSQLDGSFTTLAEILREAGFETAGVGSHTFLGKAFGLQQGFEHYDAELIQASLVVSHEAITSPQVTDKAIAWLEPRAGGERRWFLWVHYFDPHQPYLEHEGISERFGVGSEEALYEGEIAFTDRAIGRLLRRLAELDLADEAVVVLAADHGEEFGEHGGAGHGRHLHHELLHVPLLFRAAGFEPRVVEAPAGLIDVLPTVLDLLGLPIPDAAEGRSLVLAMEGESLPPRPRLAEVRLYNHFDSLELGPWKLVRIRSAGSYQLFDRRSDPMEQWSVGAARPEVVARLIPLLEGAVREARARGRSYAVAGPAELGEAELRSLRELGYLEGP